VDAPATRKRWATCSIGRRTIGRRRTRCPGVLKPKSGTTARHGIRASAQSNWLPGLDSNQRHPEQSRLGQVLPPSTATYLTVFQGFAATPSSPSTTISKTNSPTRTGSAFRPSISGAGGRSSGRTRPRAGRSVGVPKAASSGWTAARPPSGRGSGLGATTTSAALICAEERVTHRWRSRPRSGAR
jgi:hypothetical protein